MKKKGLIIASVLILALSVVFLGCPPDEEETEPTPLEIVNGYLTAMGANKIAFPAGGTYTGVYVDNETTPTEVFVAWEGCTETIFNTYKSTFPSKINLARAAYTFTENAGFIGGVGTGIEGFVDFVTTACTYESLSIKANSIIIKIYKNIN
jgi:hypothetical protein